MDTLPFEAELKRYLQFIRLEKGLADHTVSAYITDLRRYFLFIRIDQKLQSLDGVTLDHIENYLGVLTDLGLATSSMARNISSIRSFHEFAVVENLEIGRASCRDSVVRCGVAEALTEVR